MRKVYLLIITVTINQLLTAQQIYFSKPEDTTKAKELSEVVVTGQYKPQSARNSVYQVRIISKVLHKIRPPVVLVSRCLA